MRNIEKKIDESFKILSCRKVFLDLDLINQKAPLSVDVIKNFIELSGKEMGSKNTMESLRALFSFTVADRSDLAQSVLDHIGILTDEGLGDAAIVEKIPINGSCYKNLTVSSLAKAPVDFLLSIAAHPHFFKNQSKSNQDCRSAYDFLFYLSCFYNRSDLASSLLEKTNPLDFESYGLSLTLWQNCTDVEEVIWGKSNAAAAILAHRGNDPDEWSWPLDQRHNAVLSRLDRMSHQDLHQLAASPLMRKIEPKITQKLLEVSIDKSSDHPFKASRKI